jgi:hypothetical protein
MRPISTSEAGDGLGAKSFADEADLDIRAGDGLGAKPIADGADLDI